MTGHSCSFPQACEAEPSASRSPPCCREKLLRRTDPGQAARASDAVTAATAWVQAELCLQKLTGRGHQCVIPCGRQALRNVKSIWLPLPLAKKRTQIGTPLQLKDIQTGQRRWDGGKLQTPLLAIPTPQSWRSEGPVQGLLEFPAKELHAHTIKYLIPA